MKSGSIVFPEDMQGRLARDWLERWYIVKANAPGLAWAGFRWVMHRGGLGTYVQVSNFTTELEARQAAEGYGLELVEDPAPAAPGGDSEGEHGGE